MNKIKLTVAVVVGLLLILFCVQNTTIVDVKFLMFQMSISRSLLILIVYFAGFVSGLISFRVIPSLSKKVMG